MSVDTGDLEFIDKGKGAVFITDKKIVADVAEQRRQQVDRLETVRREIGETGDSQE